MKLQTARGMRDILPDDQKYWSFAKKQFNKVASSLGYKRLSIPVVEYSELFKRGIGEETDIVEKELFTIVGRGEDAEELALRPEFTAGCVRSYIENGFKSKPQPVLLSLMGPAYRRERPQKNRYREFFQLDLEVIGDASPKYDFLIIQSTILFLNSIKLSNLIVSLNSIGCKDCRPDYTKKLIEHIKNSSSNLCTDCQKRLEKNPLRVLDCKESKCQDIVNEAPKTIDNLCPDCKKHLDDLIAYLKDFNIEFELNSKLVRGLDYYNRTVFEVNQKDDTGRQSSICGGGRYDYLFEMIGEKSTPAVGMAIGLDRVVNLLKETNIDIPNKHSIKLMIVGVGEVKKECMDLYNALLKIEKISFYLPSTDTLGKQLEFANKLGAEFVAIIGEDEAKNNHYLIKNLLSGKQHLTTRKQFIKDILA